MKPKTAPYYPDSATADALCRLICAYVDLKIPTPEELVFMVPDDGQGHIEKRRAADEGIADEQLSAATVSRNRKRKNE